MNDDQLLAQVRTAFTELDPVPGGVLAAGTAAIRWRVPGAVLAELAADQDAACAGIRGDSRLLTFTGPDVAVEIEVIGSGGDRELIGRLAPPAPAEVAVRHPGGELTVWADRSGNFTVTRVPAGPVSLVFWLPDASSVVTSWISL